MERFITIARAAFAALALTLVVAACGEDDRSPTQLDPQPETPAATVNPWTSIFAAAEVLGGPARVTFARHSDRLFRVRKLDPGLAVPEDGPDTAPAVCTVADPRDRRDLDTFRQCMAKALREDTCRSGGAFVLYPPTATTPGWRAYCPQVPRVEAGRNHDDEPGRVKNIAALRLPLGRPAARLG